MKKSKYKQRVISLENQLFINDTLSRTIEKHLEIAERELQAKERLIINLKDWVTTLIKETE